MTDTEIRLIKQDFKNAQDQIDEQAIEIANLKTLLEDAQLKIEDLEKQIERLDGDTTLHWNIIEDLHGMEIKSL